MPSVILSPRKLMRQTHALSPWANRDSTSSPSSILKKMIRKRSLSFKCDVGNNTSCANKTDKTSLSVSFAPMVALIRVQPWLDEERSDMWYSRDEICAIKARNTLLAQLHRDGYFVETQDETFFGLERTLRRDDIRCQQESLYDAVFAEQHRQKSGSKTHPGKLAKVYRQQIRRMSVE